MLQELIEFFKRREWERLKGEKIKELKERKDLEGNFDFKIERGGIFEFPRIEDVKKLNVFYDLIPPFAKAHIYWDWKNKEIVYEVVEPVLSKEEREKLERIKKLVESNIDTPYSELETDEFLISYLEHLISKILLEEGIEIDGESYGKIMYYIYRDFAGLNEIEPLMRDPFIEDIGCDGVNVHVFVVHSKLGSIRTNLIYRDEEKLRNFVVKLAERCGKYISYAEPILDGSLPDGSRVNASFSRDITSKGPTFSIRKFHVIPFSAIDMLYLKTASEDIMAYLWMALQYRKNILIIGGTDTGKTSFLNSIVAFIPPEDKIVSIEDTRELQLPHENWIPSVSRPSYNLSEEGGEITMFHLLKESFRQNPDYVIVGEVRGEEASVMFQGMASGHSSMSTMHASTPNSVVKRLITPPINLSPSLIETLDIIIIMTRAREKGKSARRVKAIHEVEGITESNNLRTNEIFAWTSIDDSFYFKGIENSRVLSEIRRNYGLSPEELKREFINRRKVIEYMKEKNVRSFEEVAKIVSEYYRDKENLLKKIKG